MPDLLQPDKNSRENIDLFLEAIEDQEIRRLLTNHLEDILAVGGNPDLPDNRRCCFESVKALIEDRIEERR